MEKITTDISTFENLRKGGYVYVDKTDILWRLVSDIEGRQFFISRPRRFGNRAALLRVRGIMHDFHIEPRNHEKDIRFLMQTGVTKLTKVSVLSGLNRLGAPGEVAHVPGRARRHRLRHGEAQHRRAAVREVLTSSCLNVRG